MSSMSKIARQKAFWSFSTKCFTCTLRTVRTIPHFQTAILQRADRVRGLCKTIKSQSLQLGQFNVRMIILHSLTMASCIPLLAVRGQRRLKGSILLVQASLLLRFSDLKLIPFNKRDPEKSLPRERFLDENTTIRCYCFTGWDRGSDRKNQPCAG